MRKNSGALTGFSALPPTSDIHRCVDSYLGFVFSAMIYAASLAFELSSSLDLQLSSAPTL